jgi:hypothetical protein
VDTAQAGPAGEPMVQVRYPVGRGQALTLSQWLPAAPQAAGLGCRCVCRAPGQCQRQGLEQMVGPVRVRVELSAAGLITPQDLQAVVDTLGPAAGQQAYAYRPRAPLAEAAPPAEVIPVGADGAQAVTLVVAPEGYTPAHFAVKRGVPVRLTFRQLGPVGCGNELRLTWGAGQSAVLVLETASETETLEFTPGEAGEFVFACPHQIYRGRMTVVE